MRKQLIVGNWKMNGSLSSIKSLCESLNQLPLKKIDAHIALCVPDIFFLYVSENIKNIDLGIQNVSQYSNGPYTGETSATMARDLNCQYVIVGHSERRNLFGESSYDASLKAKKAIESGLCPIICIGETLDQRFSNEFRGVLKKQLHTILNKLSIKQLKETIIAYEPIWAIGTGVSASPTQIQEAHFYIRSLITKFDVLLAKSIKIIYGGSLKPKNSGKILKLPDVDGGLVGNASLSSRDFYGIIENVKA